MRTTKKRKTTNFLKNLRNTLEISDEQQAVLLGIRFSTLYRWERGITKKPMLTVPQFKKLIKHVQEAGLEINDIPDDFS